MSFFGNFNQKSVSSSDTSKSSQLNASSSRTTSSRKKEIFVEELQFLNGSSGSSSPSSPSHSNNVNSHQKKHNHNASHRHHKGKQFKREKNVDMFDVNYNEIEEVSVEDHVEERVWNEVDELKKMLKKQQEQIERLERWNGELQMKASLKSSNRSNKNVLKNKNLVLKEQEKLYVYAGALPDVSMVSKTYLDYLLYEDEELFQFMVESHKYREPLDYVNEQNFEKDKREESESDSSEDDKSGFEFVESPVECKKLSKREFENRLKSLVQKRDVRLNVSGDSIIRWVTKELDTVEKKWYIMRLCQKVTRDKSHILSVLVLLYNDLKWEIFCEVLMRCDIFVQGYFISYCIHTEMHNVLDQLFDFYFKYYDWLLNSEQENMNEVESDPCYDCYFVDYDISNNVLDGKKLFEHLTFLIDCWMKYKLLRVWKYIKKANTTVLFNTNSELESILLKYHHVVMNLNMLIQRCFRNVPQYVSMKQHSYQTTSVFIDSLLKLKKQDCIGNSIIKNLSIRREQVPRRTTFSKHTLTNALFIHQSKNNSKVHEFTTKNDISSKRFFFTQMIVYLEQRKFDEFLALVLGIYEYESKKMKRSPSFLKSWFSKSTTTSQTDSGHSSFNWKESEYLFNRSHIVSYCILYDVTYEVLKSIFGNCYKNQKKDAEEFMTALLAHSCDPKILYELYMCCAYLLESNSPIVKKIHKYINK